MVKTYTEADFAQDELDRYRLAEQRRLDEERQSREDRRREFDEQIKLEERTATSWPEALGKQATLFRREAAQWITDGDPDNLFGPGAQACDRALEIWKEIAAGKQAAIDELKAQIAAIQDSIRVETADRLEAESKIEGWRYVATALRTEDMNRWLYW